MKTKQTFISDLHLVCASKNDLNKSLQCIRFVNEYAYACNGHILIKQHLKFSDVVDKHKLENKHIFNEDFKVLRKCEIVTAYDDYIVGYNSRTKKEVKFDYVQIENPINFEMAIPLLDERYNPKNIIGLDIKLLYALQQSMYHPKQINVVKMIQVNNRSTLVQALDVLLKDQLGLIMHCSIDTLF